MALITCPTDCATGGVPDVAFDLCNPTFKYGEVNTVILAQKGHPLATGDATEIATRLAAVDETKIVILYGYGDVPAGTGEPNRLSSRYVINPPKERSLNFTVVDLNATNYEFARKIDKCGGNYLMYYTTVDGDMYGGENFNDGIDANVTGSHIIPAGRAEVQTLQLAATWTGAMPERKPSVLA